MVVLELLCDNPIHHFANVNFCSPQSSVGSKNCKYSELVRQNITEQHYFAPTEA